MLGLRSLAPLATAVAYGAAAAVALALTKEADGITTMWPSSGILFGAIAVVPRRSTWKVVSLTAAASMIANLTAGYAVAISLAYTVVNMIEGLIAAGLLRRWCVQRPSFINPRDVFRFCAAAAVASLFSAGLAWTVSGEGWLFALSWLTTVFLGMLIVAPMILIAAALVDPVGRDEVRMGSDRQATALLLMVAIVSTAVFSQGNYPVLFVPFVAMLAATYWLGPFGAAAGVLIVACVSSVAAALGRGPLAPLGMTETETAFFLQFYYVALFATALPLAALLTARKRLSACYEDSERMHRLLADSSTDIIIRCSLDGVPVYVSPAVSVVLGFVPKDLVGRQASGDIHPEDLRDVRRAWARVAAGASEVCVYRQRKRDGEYAWLEAACRLVETPKGAEIVGSLRDVTKRRIAEIAAGQAQRKLQEANRLLVMAERAAGVGHWRIDFTGESIFWSPEVFRIHGVGGFTPPGLADAVAFYHPEDRDRVDAIVQRSLQTAKGFEFEARIVRVDGEVRHVISRGQPEFGYDGEPVGLFGTLHDVTQQVKVERELEAARRSAEEAAARAMHMADTDALTGVASRRKTMAALDDMIALARASGEPLALAIFDIDHFKSVNDRHGHAAGDAVLVRVARAAREAVRPTDLVGRLGGEEFVVLLPGANAEQAAAISEQLRGAIAASADGVESGPPVTASLGVATLEVERDAAALLGEADRALYRAKAAGRNAVRLAA